MCKFQAGIPPQRKAELLHEIRGFLRDKGIVGWATYGCIEVSTRMLCALDLSLIWM